jgi:hypothetical protein
MPQLPAAANVAALLSFLNLAASFWWTCKNARQRLADMTAEERAAMPDYDAKVNAAEQGMKLAESEQQEARNRLIALSALPSRWNAWPERRLFPRPDIR